MIHLYLDDRGHMTSENTQHMENIRIMLEISGLIRSEEPLETKFGQALELARQVIAFDAASLFLYDDRAGELTEMATIGQRVELIESTRFEMGTGLSAWVAKQRDVVLLPDVRKNREDGFRSFVSIPLFSGETFVGVLNLGHREPGFFSDWHVRFLEIIAGELALLIDRSRFEQELREINQQLRDARDRIEEQQRTIIDMERYQVLAQVVASINHELNNPLTTILGNLELLMLQYPDLDPDITRKIELVHAESRRMSAIIEKLRDVKQVVVKEYLDQTGETMLDIDQSLEQSDGKNFPATE